MSRRLAALCAALALPAAMAQAQTIPSDEPPGPLAHDVARHHCIA